MYESRFDTALGTAAVIATEQGICRVVLPAGRDTVRVGCSGESAFAPSPLTEHVAKLLKSYFRGERQLFDDIAVDLAGVSDFRARVLMMIRDIPYGEVRSYGQVACMAGTPRGARAIGGAMASNPVPIIIPCHRVVAANGRLTGYSAPGGLKLKKEILEVEGIEFKGELVLMKIAGYKQSDLA